MTKTQLIDGIADKAELSKTQAKAALESTLAAITESLKEGDAVQLVGFGTFKVNHRAERTGRTTVLSALAATRRPVKKSKSPQLTYRHLFLVKH